MAIIHEAECDTCNKRTAIAAPYQDLGSERYPAGWVLLIESKGTTQTAFVDLVAFCSWSCVEWWAKNKRATVSEQLSVGDRAPAYAEKGTLAHNTRKPSG